MAKRKEVAIVPGDIFTKPREQGRETSHELAILQDKLRIHFLKNCTEEKLKKVFDAMHDLAVNCSDDKVKLAACNQFLEWTIGKNPERVQIDPIDNPTNTGINLFTYRTTMEVLPNVTPIIEAKVSTVAPVSTAKE